MKLLKEPLLHFLLLGLVLFGVHGLLSEGTGTEAGRIVVTQGRIEALATAFHRTWQRPPTTGELDELIRDYIRQEACARAAIALGLDKDDIVIQRRLRQKLEFVSEDVAVQAEPTEDQLRSFLHGRPETFRIEPQFTFHQVFLSPERRGENLVRDAAQMLAHLRQDDAQDQPSGDSTLLERSFDALPSSLVARQFGNQFATKLDELPPGQWHGPIPSTYGAHLVFVSQRTKSRLPDLGEVREAVRREWAHAQRLAAREQFYQTLLQRYHVTVERPQPAKALETTHLGKTMQ